MRVVTVACLFLLRESGVGSALEVLIIDLVYSGSLVCGIVCAVSTLYTTTAAYYIVHIRQLGPCNVTLRFQLLGSLVWSVCLSVFCTTYYTTLLYKYSSIVVWYLYIVG